MSRRMLERLVALTFLVGAIAYGREAQRIDLLFGAEFSPFNARTFPTALAVAAGVVSFLILIAPGAPADEGKHGAGAGNPLAGLAWRPALALGGLLVLYAVAISYAGFFLASALFLGFAMPVLGERRPALVAAVAVGVSLALFLILNTLLGIYLDDPLLRAIGLA